MRHSYYLGFLPLLFVAELATADGFAYGWKDQEGRWHFSDQRPRQQSVIVDLSPRNAAVGNLGAQPGARASESSSLPSMKPTVKAKVKQKAKPSTSSEAVSPTAVPAGEAQAAECLAWRERLSLSAGLMAPTARRKLENDYDRKCILGQR